MQSYQDARQMILNSARYRALTSDQKRLPKTKDDVRRLIIRQINLNYHGVFKLPRYSSQRTIDALKTGVTCPLKRATLDSIKDCFSIDPTKRPSVHTLIQTLSTLISPPTDTLAASAPTVASSATVASTPEPPRSPLSDVSNHLSSDSAGSSIAYQDKTFIVE